MAQLDFRSGLDKGKVLEVPPDPASVGRSADNVIVVNDSRVSRRHAVISERDGDYYIRDLGSGNATFVNDIRCAPEMPLQHGDVIRLGDTVIVFNAPELDHHGATALKQDDRPINVFSDGPTASVGMETIAFRLSSLGHDPEVNLAGHHLGILVRVANAFQSGFDTDTFLRTLMDTLFETFFPDRGAILLHATPGGPLEPRVKQPEGIHLEISQTVIQEAIERREALLIGDIAQDDRFSGAQSIITQGIQSAICAPLVRQEEVLGVIYLDARTRPMHYQKEDLALLNIIAANTAIALENARLFREKLDAERLAAMGVAVAGISHYIKNVLMGITGAAGVIDMAIESKNWDTLGGTWPVMKRSARRMGDLVQDMLTYSKRREPEWTPGSLNDVVSDVFENQKERAAEKGVEFRLEPSASLPNSEFDPKGIHDTVLNITGNAIEACEGVHGSAVCLRTDRDDASQRLVIEIRDTGLGIAPDIQAKIFEPFFSTKGSKGTGLGLAIARKTVEEHGGRLSLESELGKGTTFRIEMPLKERAV